jgi:Mn2+/Fe2+ NRAMP family transporter
VTDKNTPAAVPMALAACAVAVLGVAAIWAAASVFLKGPAAWFAIVAALDATLLLNLANWPRGGRRVAVAVTVTVLTIIVAQYFVATANIGVAMGLRPYESLPLMSLDLAGLYATTNTGPFEWACYAIAVVVAWAMARA